METAVTPWGWIWMDGWNFSFCPSKEAGRQVTVITHLNEVTQIVPMILLRNAAIQASNLQYILFFCTKAESNLWSHHYCRSVIGSFFLYTVCLLPITCMVLKLLTAGSALCACSISSDSSSINNEIVSSWSVFFWRSNWGQRPFIFFGTSWRVQKRVLRKHSHGETKAFRHDKRTTWFFSLLSFQNRHAKWEKWLTPHPQKTLLP